MMLSDRTLQDFINSGKIKIFPEFNPDDIRPTGIRLHLANDLLIPTSGQRIDLDSSDDVKFDKVIIPQDGYVLKPGHFILGSTHEKFQVPRDIVCHIEGRSTIARLGLAIHCTSGIIDGNFDEARSIVLEIKNMGPFEIVLRHKTPLALLTFNQLTTDIAQNSQKQYAGQEGTLAPNLKSQKV